MVPSTTETTAIVAGSGQRREDPKKIASAASDFEALLLAQLLRSAREAASLDGTDSEAAKSSDSIMEFAEQQFGGILAKAGGLGLSKLVVSGLTPKG
jgi:Rod binding domain-containing protein